MTQKSHEEMILKYVADEIKTSPNGIVKIKTQGQVCIFNSIHPYTQTHLHIHAHGH